MNENSGGSLIVCLKVLANSVRRYGALTGGLRVGGGSELSGGIKFAEGLERAARMLVHHCCL